MQSFEWKSVKSPRSSKILVTKEKEIRKRNTVEKERRRRKKNKGCILSFYYSYCGDSFLGKKTVGHERFISQYHYQKSGLMIQPNEQHWCQIVWNAVYHIDMAHFVPLEVFLGNNDPAKWAALMPNRLKRCLPHWNGTLCRIRSIFWKQWSSQISSINVKEFETMSTTSK